MKPNRVFRSGFLPFLLVLAFCCLTGGNGMAAPRTFWVDSRTGDDLQDGTSPRRAWRTLERLSCCSLQPGDVVSFARGSRFDGCLDVHASGSAAAPIRFTSYGCKHLPAPLFTNSDTAGFGNCIRLRGDYLHVGQLAFAHTLAEIPQQHRIASFTDMWQLGAVVIDSSARHCVIRGCEFTDCGVGIKSNGEYTLIEGNHLHDCTRVLKQWSWGPIAVWLGADHQEVRYNVIRNYRAEDASIVWKTAGPLGADGGAVEIDDGRTPKHDIAIHHNFSQGNQGFLEVTYKDVVTAPDYGGLHIYDNISDDYQSFALLWHGRDCLFEHNTIIRRKRNGNEQGVFRIMQTASANTVWRNLIVTADSVVVSRNRSGAGTELRDNCYCPLGGRLRPGRERESGKPLTASLATLPAGYGARSTDGRSLWFDRLCDAAALTSCESTDPGMPAIPEDESVCVVLARHGKMAVTFENLAPQDTTVVYACEQLKTYLTRMSGADTVASAVAGKIVLAAGGISKGQNSPPLANPGTGDSYSITVSGGDILLWGESPRALLCAVYGLLERLGCCWLAPDYDFYEGAAEVVPETKALVYSGPERVVVKPVLPSRKIYVEEGLSHDERNLRQLVEWMPKAGYNTLVVPIDYQGKGRVMWDKMRSFLMPELRRRSITLEVGGHGYQNFLNASSDGGALFGAHPEWFGMDEQGERRREPRYVICTSQSRAVEYLIDSVKGYLRAHPEIDTFAFWPPDGAKWCRCEACRAFGSDSEKHVRLVNRVAEALREEFPHLRVECLAYEVYLDPARKNVLSPAVMVDFCPIDQCFETQIDDAANPKNRMYVTAFRQWRDRFDGQINLYSYYRKYAWRSLPLVLPHYIADDVRWYAANGASGVSIYGEPGDWAAYEVNHYLLARVAANPALDVDSLLCGFTQARYGRHAAFAREVLDLFERLPRCGAAIPNTTLKTVAEYDGWLAEIDAVAAGLARRIRGNDTYSRALRRLSLSLEYLRDEFTLCRLRAAGGSAKDAQDMIDRMVRWADSCADRGVVVTRNFTASRLGWRHGIKR